MNAKIRSKIGIAVGIILGVLSPMVITIIFAIRPFISVATGTTNEALAEDVGNYEQMMIARDIIATVGIIILIPSVIIFQKIKTPEPTNQVSLRDDTRRPDEAHFTRLLSDVLSLK